ncbi:MAG TPA: hypothetical protein VKT77_03375, partial [Chthonomonadaceae bacterium]|nr:hypothetical protein [Chthonomonadaceae bacterium]
HSVSDVGSLFGNSAGFMRQVNGRWRMGLYQNVLNDYTWTFTHPQRAGLTSAPICNYMPETKNRPFYALNLDDARWMGRMIAQLSEEQIRAALVGSGYDAATARLVLEKLVSRRDAMVRDFGLSGEFAPLRPGGADRRLTYDPASDGPFLARLANGRKLAARDSRGLVVVNGRLISRQHPHASAAL